LDRLLAEPDQGAWRRGTTGSEARLAAAWWMRFAEATRGRWEALPAGSVLAGEVWMLNHPDGRQLRLVWAPEGVGLCDVRANRCERARLAGPEQAALRAASER
jgi:hypothetical protein